jgi:hypothetical protein
VPALHQRVEGVADLAGLVGRKQLPPQTPAAWVLWLGDDAGPAADMTGGSRQTVKERIGVLLMHRVAGDSKGTQAQAELEALRVDVRGALAGWEPDSEAEPIEYLRGRLLEVPQGIVFMQLDFVAQWYLRAS